jgi:hypothetical protein
VLRTFSRQLELPLDDTDATLGPLWYATAYPEDFCTAQKRARNAGVVRRGRRK